MTERIFITGATGCIGRYVLDDCLKRPNAEIHILVRDPQKVPTSLLAYPNLVVHKGDLDSIEQQQDVLKQTTHLIHLATVWGDSDESTRMNLEKSMAMFEACDPAVLKRIVYFSTASILGKGNRVLEEAETYGTGYVRSKYRAYKAFKASRWADRMVTIFPTLVFGGAEDRPYSHICGGLLDNLHYAKWVRFLYMDAHFHFMHAADTAQVVVHALDHEVPADLVVGQRVYNGKETIKILSEFAGYKVWFQLKLNPKGLLKLAQWMKVYISPWDLFCITNPHFEYQVVSPETFGLKSKFPTLLSLLEDLRAHPPK